jgi:predicted O-linked N-acetylglucosamine transferase (SPINDLY family)
MRGRLASGILKRMEMPELVARSEEEYIDLVVRLTSDNSYNQQVRRRIEAKRAVLFNDLAPIRAFEDFLLSVSKRPQTCPSST